jgi:hypothetical protein
MRKRRGFTPPYKSSAFEKHRRVARALVIRSLINPPGDVGIQGTAYSKNDIISETIAYFSNLKQAPALPAVATAPVLDWNPARGLVVGGGVVQSIADSSGNGNTGVRQHNLINAGSCGTLVRSDPTFNGYPTIAISQAGSAPQGIRCLAFSGYTEMTVFLVWIDLATVGSDPGGSLYTASTSSFNVSGTVFDIMSSASGAGNADGSVTNVNGTSSFNIAPDWALTGASATYVHQCNGTNASHIIRLNGVTKSRGSTISATDPGTNTPANQTFAMPGTSAGAGLRSGRLARCVAYPAALSLGNIQTLEAYFTSVYGA